MGDERPVGGRPGHEMCGGDFGDRAGGVTDRDAQLTVSRPVVRARIGICSTESVKVPRWQ
ncbi:hypothetical protein [Rhodococcus sp. OK302]|uniref:hypothetical protein n=1 Tax=Rhodococcus sp. OK302 TaxID=1882769 RepID=UPI001594FF8A|nr:hypothetical protein [Rhodococcus sp. OK302]